MKRKSIDIRLVLVLIAFSLSNTSIWAQQMMTISSGIKVSPEYMVRKILLNQEDDLLVTNVRHKGQPVAIGVFNNSSKYYLLQKGLILSTGRVEDAFGPNDANNTGVPLHQEGDPELRSIATGKTYDANVLSFDFVANSDSIAFNFVFASEEYPEYVKKGVNDIFAFFLEHKESGQVTNLAVFGAENKIVNVDNINWHKNSHLYIENAQWDPSNIMQWAKDPGRGELALTYQYDGFTTLMSAGSVVIPGDTYRISFAIADVGDYLYDSAVFLEKGSFGSENREKSERQKLIVKKLKDGLTDQSIELIDEHSEIKLRLHIQFDFDDDAIRLEKDKKQLDEIIRLLRIHKDIQVNIEGHTDNVGNDDYNDELSSRRALSVANYLINKGLDEERLGAYGFGSNRPVTENITNEGRYQNRRVDLVFY